MKFHKSGSLRAKLITILRLALSHLRKHNFKHSFHDTLNALVVVDAI